MFAGLLALAVAVPVQANGLASGQVASLIQDAVTPPSRPEPEPETAPAIRTLTLPPGLFLQQQATPQSQVPVPQSSPSMPLKAKADFQPASFTKMLQYSLQLIFYEHVMRVAVQPWTRAELKGPFWLDYYRSVKMPQQWGDGDSWQINYIGHSMHGSAGVRLWLAQREPLHMERKGKDYWKAMGRAGLFGLLFSEQFEIGPMSEASIGNVGMYPGRTGWVDHVITPLGSIGWTMYEDAVDKYVLTWVEKHVPFAIAKAAARMIACPAWMLANVGMNRVPWHRDNRSLTFSK